MDGFLSEVRGSFKGGARYRGEGFRGSAQRKVPEVRGEHVNAVLKFGPKLYQAICGCGWSSTIGYYEQTDLLRAMHAHAVVTFGAYA